MVATITRVFADVGQFLSPFFAESISKATEELNKSLEGFDKAVA